MSPENDSIDSASDASSDDLSLVEAVRLCRRNDIFLNALGELFAKVDAEVDSAANMGRQAHACMGGGVCCRFDLMGHRLYLSAGELAFLTRASLPAEGQFRPLRCPYQVGPRCFARQFRPLGCRVFFCRCREDQQQETYEIFHAKIRYLHNFSGLPYRYIEMTAALDELRQAGDLLH